jgi:tetratricopeptide (TPR) repeat protein
LIIALGFSYLFFTAETAQQNVGRYAPPKNAAAQPRYEEFVTKSLTIKPIEPRFRFMAAQFFFKARMNDQAVEQLKQAIDNDLREFESRNTLADYYEQLKKPELALPIREYIVTIDPYNIINLLALGRDLKATGDIEGARAIVEKIASIAPESEELKVAKSEFLA